MKPISIGHEADNVARVSWNARQFSAFFEMADGSASFAAISNVKRTLLEFMFSLLLLITLSPVFLFVSILVKISSVGPILYFQERVGKDGAIFDVIKFRTMVVDAEKKTGATLSWKSDPRVTKVGSFLRKSHLDELPQLLNILFGEMSFIGPRPERPIFTNVYNREIIGYSRRKDIKPGITGLAQISCEYDALPENKLQFDLLYLQYRNSFMLNSLITLYTVKKMFFWKTFEEVSYRGNR